MTYILATPSNIAADTRISDRIASRIAILTKVVTTTRFCNTNRNHNADGRLHHIRVQEIKLDTRLPSRFT